MKQKIFKIFCVMILIGITATTAFADDGPIVRKNISSTPDYDTEYVSTRMLPLYVPAQTSAGVLDTDGIPYYNADGVLVKTLYYAQPLIESYQDGPVTFIDDPAYEAFPGHGARDAYVAVSLDDGLTWKRTNISNSAKRSSIRINGKPYPGDTLRNFLASDGNKVLFVWASKYCGSGSPAYAMTDTERSALATYLASTGTITDAAACTDGDPLTPCPYLEDAFGVAGSQGVQSAADLAEEGYPLVGDYPYSCLWAARGVLLPPAATGRTTSTFVWFNAERLTSGVRSADRAEAVCVKGAGCAVIWQEDPEGVRPGEGDGPGEGWSGAVAHHQTDTWYSFIDWDDFDLVSGDGTYGTFYGTDLTTSGASLAAYVAANPTGSPKAAVPMSIPMRVTDNAMCTANDSDPYCYIDFNGNGTPDLCASTVNVTIETPEGPTQDVDMCVAEDGRLMRGNTASTRPRLSLHGYSTAGPFDRTQPDRYPINSAWVSFSYEENKGLGDICDDGDCDILTDADKRDMGKNIWYHTFDMFKPELVSQGMMLNQPATYPQDWSDPTGLLEQDTSFGYNFWKFKEDPIYNTLAGLTTTTLYQTEIARRASQVTQDWYDAGVNGTVAFNLWKQGIIRRGGPADVMGRRWKIPPACPLDANGNVLDDGTCFNATVDNPYDYHNMVCENADNTSGWAYRTDLGQPSNPRYVKGFCAAPAINLSGTTILSGDTCTDAASCLDAFPFNDYFDDLAMEQGTGISKILTWTMLGPNYGEDPTPADTSLTSLDDPSWENPYDMAKGHRGFLAGDMVMIMYAWTNNWDALTEGHDIVNLYARRSFDGGQTWTTLPANFTHTSPAGYAYLDPTLGTTYHGDGTFTCEFMGPTGGTTEYPVCKSYAAGEFEQARDLSQLTGSSVTVLDPRYAPTTRSITTAWVTTASLPAGFTAPCDGVTDCAYDDTRDPSHFHMVFETGITSAYDEGEAEPLDLFYSRAVNWGDDYLVWQEETDTSLCLPGLITDSAGVSGLFCNEFDALEGSQFSISSEASLVSSPGGQFLYAGWFQEDFDVRTGAEIGIDAWFRRIMYLDGYIPGDDGGSGPVNTAPGPKILNPANGATFILGVPITFSGTATDAEDGDLTTKLIWTSNLDGQIGTGGSFTRTLSLGAHTITASVTDSGGLTSSTAINVTVVQPPFNLSVTTRVVKTNKYADLIWSGPLSVNVDVYRNGLLIVTTPNDGSYTDKPPKTTTSAVYKVCLAGTTTCSNAVTAVWTK
ncbi:MAG: choice-of-anchor O protein [Chloroflexota bacterium]